MGRYPPPPQPPAMKRQHCAELLGTDPADPMTLPLCLMSVIYLVPKSPSKSGFHAAIGGEIRLDVRLRLEGWGGQRGMGSKSCPLVAPSRVGPGGIKKSAVHQTEVVTSYWVVHITALVCLVFRRATKEEREAFLSPPPFRHHPPLSC